MSRCYHIEVVAYGLDDAANEALFDRVMYAAHELDEQLTVSGECACICNNEPAEVNSMTRPDMQKQADRHNFPCYIPGHWVTKTTDEKITHALDALDKAWTEIRRLEDLNNSLAEINNRLFFQMLDAYGSNAAAVARDHLASLNDVTDSRPGPEQGGTQTSTKPAGTGQNQAPGVA